MSIEKSDIDSILQSVAERDQRDQSRTLAPNPKFLGLAGTFNAGKDTGADHLANEHGYMHVSTGDVLREVAAHEGLDDSRATLAELGRNLRRKYGHEGALVIKAKEEWEEKQDEYAGGLVVTGLRVIGEAQAILDGNGVLTFVESTLPVSYQRMLARQRDSEALQTFEEFAARQAIEMDGDPDDPTRPKLSAIRKIAHFVLQNEDLETPEPYLHELEAVLGLPRKPWADAKPI